MDNGDVAAESDTNNALGNKNFRISSLVSPLQFFNIRNFVQDILQKWKLFFIHFDERDQNELHTYPALCCMQV